MMACVERQIPIEPDNVIAETTTAKTSMAENDNATITADTAAASAVSEGTNRAPSDKSSAIASKNADQSSSKCRRVSVCVESVAAEFVVRETAKPQPKIR